MAHIHQHAGTMGAIPRRVREREISRQFRYNDARKAAIRGRSAVPSVATRTPALAREFLGTFLGALAGFLVIAELLAHIAGVSELYTFSAFGSSTRCRPPTVQAGRRSRLQDSIVPLRTP